MGNSWNKTNVEKVTCITNNMMWRKLQHKTNMNLYIYMDMVKIPLPMFLPCKSQFLYVNQEWTLKSNRQITFNALEKAYLYVS